jgi:uncharacterized protein (UPF0332 family)
MILTDQKQIKEEYYSEALRYMDNAKETLQKAGKDGSLYLDVKYVKTACGTAYNAVLIAMDCMFLIKGISAPKRRKSIEYYRNNASKVDRKSMDFLNSAYNVLHLDGYYDGIKAVKVIQSGFDSAYEIIEKIKPENG